MTDAIPEAHVRRQMQRGRELWEDRQEQERAIAEMKRRFEMTHFKTGHGDRVAKPPSTDPVRRQVDDLYELAADALDVVAEAARREAAIEHTDPVDRRRFPAVPGGDAR